MHEKVQVEEILEAKRMHPEAEVLTHPECAEAVLEVSDYIGSTSGIIRLRRRKS